MATFTRLSKSQLTGLAKAAERGFANRGIKANVTLTTSGLPGRYRMLVVAKDFDRLLEAERHSLIREVLHEHWQPEDRLRLTLFLALTPTEAEGIL